MRFRPSLRSLGRRAASLLCGLAVLSAIAYGVALANGYHFFVEMSGSMAPSITTGSVILSKPVPGSSVHVGQVVSFIAPDGSGRVITHRLHSVLHHNGKTGYRTKGDANPTIDPWIVQFPRQVGIEKLSIPLVGYALYGLSMKPARILLVAAIAVTFALLLVGRLWRTELEDLEQRLQARKVRSTA